MRNGDSVVLSGSPSVDMCLFKVGPDIARVRVRVTVRTRARAMQ